MVNPIQSKPAFFTTGTRDFVEFSGRHQIGALDQPRTYAEAGILATEFEDLSESDYLP
jgi:hypothetical protein